MHDKNLKTQQKEPPNLGSLGKISRYLSAKEFLEIMSEELSHSCEVTQEFEHSKFRLSLAIKKIKDYPEIGKNAASGMIEFCIHSDEVKPILPYFYQLFKNLNDQAKSEIFDHLLNCSKSRKGKDRIALLIEAALMASNSRQELFERINRITEMRSWINLNRRCCDFYDFYHLHYAVHSAGIKKPSRCTSNKADVIKESINETRAWLKTLREKILASGIPRSKPFAKLYLEIIDNARSYLRKGLNKYKDPESRKNFINDFQYKVALELRFAIRIDQNESKFRSWDRLLLKSLHQVLSHFSEVQVIMTPRLNRIILGKATGSWNTKIDENYGIRKFAGHIFISTSNVPSTIAREADHGGFSRFRSTLIHEIAHAIHYGAASSVRNRAQFYPDQYNFNPLFDNSLFFDFTGWNILEKDQFEITDKGKMIKVDGVKYPLELPCKFKGHDTTFRLLRERVKDNGHSRVEKIIVYQINGEKHFSNYGTTQPVEQIAMSAVDFQLRPKELIRFCPLMYLFLDANIGSAKHTSSYLQKRALNRIANKEVVSLDEDTIINFGKIFSLEIKNHSRLKLSFSQYPHLNLRFRCIASGLLENIIKTGKRLLDSNKHNTEKALIFTYEILKFHNDGSLKIENEEPESIVSAVTESFLSNTPFHELKNLLRISDFGPQIRIMHAATPQIIAYTMMRFQEHYESQNPQFKGNTFSHEEFKKWYAESRGLKGFSYYADWSGFNFPDTTTLPFIKGKFPNLTTAEKFLLAATANIKGKHYVIAAPENESGKIDIGYLRHELCHAYYYLIPEFKLNARKILKSLNLASLKSGLMTMGYSQDVLEDECIAYLNDGQQVAVQNGLVKQKGLAKAVREIQELFLSTTRNYLASKTSIRDSMEA